MSNIQTTKGVNEFAKHTYAFNARQKIAETDTLFRDIILEQKGTIGQYFAGTKFAGGVSTMNGMSINNRFETYDINPFLRLGATHPTVSKTLQGSNVGNIDKFDGLNIIKEIKIAIPHLRFVAAHTLKTNGADTFAATYMNEDGVKIAAKETLVKVDGGVRYVDDGTGKLILQNKTKKTTKECLAVEVAEKYQRSLTYTTLANGSPFDFVVPMNMEDEGRVIPIYDATSGKFMPKDFKDEFTATKFETRAIRPAEQIVGMTMFHIPTHEQFGDVLDKSHAPVADLTMFEHNTIPQASMVVPCIAGAVNATNSKLITAGDVLPGGLIYNALMVDRSYTYLYLPYEKDEAKFPLKSTMLGVGVYGELSPGATSFVPVTTFSGATTYKVSGTLITPVDAGDTFFAYPVSGFTVFAYITDVATGKCEKIAVDNMTTNAITLKNASTFNANTVITVSLEVNEKIIIGQIDNVAMEMRYNKFAVMNTAGNELQGMTSIVRQYSEIIFGVFATAKRMWTYNKAGKAVVVNFAEQTKTVDGVVEDYTMDHFMIDAINLNLFGEARVRFDVFQHKHVTQ